MDPARRSIKVKEIFFDVKEGEDGADKGGLRFVLEDGREIGLLYFDYVNDSNFPLTTIQLK